MQILLGGNLSLTILQTSFLDAKSVLYECTAIFCKSTLLRIACKLRCNFGTNIFYDVVLPVVVLSNEKYHMGSFEKFMQFLIYLMEFAGIHYKEIIYNCFSWIYFLLVCNAGDATHISFDSDDIHATINFSTRIYHLKLKFYYIHFRIVYLENILTSKIAARKITSN